MAPALILVVGGGSVCALSGVPALFPRAGRGPARLSAMLAVLGSVLGLLGVLAGMLGEGATSVTATWPIPGGSLALGLDGLSALFLLPVFLIPAIAAVYGLGYQAGVRHDGGVRLFQGTLTAGMTLLVLARNSLLFLLGWEGMALSAFFLIAAEHHQGSARRAAWVYLVATHIGTACLIAAFALLQAPDGSLDWQPAAMAALPPGRALAVFALALVGFGLKAGLMPFHVWLPAAHANAPSHVSAVLSGVMIKMGAYGLLRLLSALPALPAACAVVVLALGTLTALLGVAATLGQSDLKRLLAYSSIENIGIVFVGIGLALLGRALGSDALIVLGLGGSLFHVLNHSLFKPLLFLSAGSVIHGTGSRDLDALGGLWRRMPRTGLAFLVGAAAICGLPLLNGFASELVLYLGLFRAATLPGTWVTVLAGAVLAGMALVSGLALLAFVRCAATVFLGHGRTPAAVQAHESPTTMTIPLLLLAALCALVGLLPAMCMPLLEGALEGSFGRAATATPLRAFVPLGALSVIALGCAAAIACGLLWLRSRRRAGAAAPPVGTWDCGYVDASSPRLQYTGASFAQPAVHMLRWTVRGRVGAPAPLELFPGPRAFVRHALEPLLHGVLWPLAHRWANRCSRLRILQRGKLHIYLLYILVVQLLLLAWSAMS